MKKFEVGKEYEDPSQHLRIKVTNHHDFSYLFETVSGETAGSGFEEGSAFAERLVPARPRICYVLGGEKMPLKIGEIFEVEGYPGVRFHINEHGIMNNSEGYTSASAIYDAINGNKKIIRRPQFSEDEKALMRLCAGSAYYQWYRDDDGTLHVKEYDEMYGPEINCVSMKGITKQFTYNNSFDAADYLESEAAK